MTINKVQEGGTLKTTASGAITKGWLIKKGAVFGVAMNSTTGNGATLVLALGGVWTLDKLAAASTNLADGGKVYARATGSAGRYKVLGVATGSVIGTAFGAAVTGATSAAVKLIDHAV